MLLVLAAAVLACEASRSVARDWSCSRRAGRLSSGFLMGATLTAMLLGHHYLTAPAMSIEPLKRFVALMAWGLVRVLCWPGSAVDLPAATAGVAGLRRRFLTPGSSSRSAGGWDSPVRSPPTDLEDGEIRSTQSATGILYIAMTFVLFGELTSMILAVAQAFHAERRGSNSARSSGLVSVTAASRRIRRAAPISCAETGTIATESGAERHRVLGGFSKRPGRRTGLMELTFSCPSCGAVGHVAAVEIDAEAACRHCGMARPLRHEAIEDGQLQACPWCMTTDLYLQKDFPRGWAWPS